MTQRIPPMFDPTLKPPLSERDAWAWDAIDAELAALVSTSRPRSAQTWSRTLK